MTNPPPPPPVQMLQLLTGFWTSCCIYCAAKLDIADRLKQGPQTAVELAHATHNDPESLYRILRALASKEIFRENDQHQFELTPLAETLLSDVPGSMKAMAIAQLGDHYRPWGDLLYSAKTGKIAFDHVEGMDVWQYYATHPQAGQNFMHAMTGMTGTAIMNVLPAYDFSGYKQIVDVGGGNGALMMAVLEQAPHATGIVFDEQYVVDETARIIEAKGLASRCKVQGGSFFDLVPEGADAYLMKMVLHDWNDEACHKILSACHRSMKPSAKLVVIEAVIPPGNAEHPGKLLDINMLVMTGGKERTEPEFAALFENAGLKISRVIPTHSPMFSIVEAIKA